MDNSYSYTVTADWTGPRKGVASVKGITPEITFSSPPEFKGESGRWTPEHFLVAAVASCFVVTFHAIAEMSKLDFLSLQLAVEGKLGKPEGKLRFTEIVLSPVLTIYTEHDRERAARLLEKAEQGCLIARSLACPVSMQPQTKIAEEVLAP
ncbi:MAG: OsmC family protein [Candidatus Acidiferrales bacterium]